MPSSLRDVMALNCAWGCAARRHTNSTPVYSGPPTIPTLITSRPYLYAGVFYFSKAHLDPINTFRMQKAARHKPDGFSML